MKKFLLSCLLICLYLFSDAQQLKDSSINIYKIYSDQVSELLKVRGLPGKEIKEMLSVFEKNRIVSDEDFAKMLSKLYPQDKGIGILFYFFNNVFLFPARSAWQILAGRIKTRSKLSMPD